jgi:hypothetical protein
MNGGQLGAIVMGKRLSQFVQSLNQLNIFTLVLLSGA